MGYETGRVLFDVGFAIEEGEIVSLLGRNGAGKTTMRSVVGADVPRVSGGQQHDETTGITGRTIRTVGDSVSIVSASEIERTAISENGWTTNRLTAALQDELGLDGDTG
ncbi:ATP-binding cassette domain-containing protein [Halosolutus gelatinilyticus]|uniref:ATP-binding cassette domain-containing protein n=1 Tax=Halosolutus gelatinilyticus TaxID=2931975 RepID=UPI001FF5DF17|nr:ATP-binding cassette domain-containing protein [Halosolutus gelatinilyticus]